MGTKGLTVVGIQTTFGGSTAEPVGISNGTRHPIPDI